jgi:primosomal protein N'
LKRELERSLGLPPQGGPGVRAASGPFKDLILAGPAPAPLLRAETFYRHQIMLRTQHMSALSRQLAKMIHSLALPEDVTLTVDVDPVDLA